LAAGLLIAAALVFALWYRPGLDGRASHPSSTTNLAQVSPTETTPAPSLDAPESRPPSFASHVVPESRSSESGSDGPLPGSRLEGTDANREAAGVENVCRYLDDPRLRRIFLIADLDGTAQQQVASVVERTTHLDYYKITISQGIVIDPRHPDQATVFALVVSPDELETLRHRLRTALKERVEEPSVDPQVVTQLADIGQVQKLTPAPLGDVDIPSDAILAFKHEGHSGPTPEQERSSPAAELAHRGGGANRAAESSRVRDAAGSRSRPSNPPASDQARSPHLVVGKEDGHAPRRSPGPAEKPAQSCVVLVWVTRSRSG
jgi:hypothetical protein